ncbi:DUF4265 domain-containing protein [Streptomyces sp. NPDC005202]|uniref:DUF4265 domain-containing protein n=1 Tax=Streptomyces sp. NPDC005202 TaxID=3157021 RepID=UPI0033AFFC0E
MSEITYITHEDPVGREAENYIAMVDLEPFGFDGMCEQIWLSTRTDGGYEVACIPFRVYGMALGDVVELRDSRFVERVAGRSGRRVFRVFFVEPRPSDDSRHALKRAVQSGGFLSEWSGDRHVAVDVPESSDPSPLFRAVQHEIDAGTAFWEWGDSEPFRGRQSD